MKAFQEVFDQYQGHDVTAFHLENDNGVSAVILSQGGIIREMNLPTKNGSTQNILLAYPTTADYYSNPFYVNMIIGTAAGRIKNGEFTIDGKTTKVAPNEGHNTLHGGPNGFNTANWTGAVASNDEAATLTLTHHFEAGEGDFPTIDVAATYTLTNDNILSVGFAAQSETPTIFNPTYHTYFNVAGSETVKDQVLQLNSPRHLDVDGEKIPTGKFLDNADTPFDFQTPVTLGSAIDQMQDTDEKGFDDIFEVVPDANNQAIAKLSDPESGRAVTLHSARNGLIVFTANSFTPDMALTLGAGKPYEGVALEAQNLSDATRFDDFGDDYVLMPGEHKVYAIGYQFEF